MINNIMNHLLPGHLPLNKGQLEKLFCISHLHLRNGWTYENLLLLWCLVYVQPDRFCTVFICRLFFLNIYTYVTMSGESWTGHSACWIAIAMLNENVFVLLHGLCDSHKWAGCLVVWVCRWLYEETQIYLSNVCFLTRFCPAGCRYFENSKCWGRGALADSCRQFHWDAKGKTVYGHYFKNILALSFFSCRSENTENLL